MGWFDEQIKQREHNDQVRFDDSIAGLAGAVMGRGKAVTLDDERLVSKLAIDEVLKYYRCRPEEVPGEIEDPEERLDYCLRPHGLMHRKVKLEKGWRKTAFGPMTVRRKEDGLPVAVIPGIRSGYWYRDPASGQRVRVGSKEEEMFETTARCYYRPLPEGRAGLPEMLGFIKGNILPADVIMFLIVTLLVTLTGLLMPVATRVLTGNVLELNSKALLIGTAQFLLCVLVTTAILEAAKALVVSRLKVRLSLSVEASVFMRVLNLPAGFFRDYGAGELAQRVQLVRELSDLLIDCIFTTGITAVMSILYVIQMVRFAPSLVAPALCVLLLTALLDLMIVLMQIKNNNRIMEQSAKSGGISYALMSGIQKIRLAGAEKRAFAKWADTYSKQASAQYDPPLFLKIGQAVITGITLVGTIVIYWLAVRAQVTPSEYMAFSAAYGLIAVAFNELSEGAAAASKIRPILKMTSPILEAEPEHAQKRSIVTKLNGSIELNNVSFRYTEGMPDVIQELDLKIHKGEYVAITGRSGCGKSTLLRLLMGFEQPRRGSICYDGHDMQTLDLHSLRRKIGTVIQNGSLIKGDIYSNIVISAPHLSMDDAWEAAEMAGIADDIRKMPMGMHTIISEGQGGLSGGQKQRLMIARAIASKPSVLLMDEATSALDNVTQKKVIEALSQLKCTRIVIAHRLSTIRQCDRILVMDQGHIVEEGTYDELIGRKGLFADLVERQRI